ncbi:hypothetical protein [Streptomyces sp. 6N223]|uniref:hypothetical protein n=1 Tax=Streptomyces sp. 6N223 TaxID=3457412 RepID=UPI003FD424AF
MSDPQAHAVPASAPAAAPDPAPPPVAVAEQDPHPEPPEPPKPEEPSAPPEASEPPEAPEPLDDEPRPLGIGVQPTGHAGVDAQLARLADTDRLPVAEHLEVYEDAHRALRDTLTTLDQPRPGPPSPVPSPGPTPGPVPRRS